MKTQEKILNINCIFQSEFPEFQFAGFAMDCYMIGKEELDRSLLQEFFRQTVIMDHMYEKKFSYIMERELQSILHKITPHCLEKWDLLMEYFKENLPNYDLEYCQPYSTIRVDMAFLACEELEINWDLDYDME